VAAVLPEFKEALYRTVSARVRALPLWAGAKVAGHRGLGKGSDRIRHRVSLDFGFARCFL
jgi:hypothetical protein